jgi:hypothetical protein
LLFHWTVPVDQYDRIGAFLLVPDELTPLHGDISHAGWVSDQASSWIQPAWVLRTPDSIKPVRDAPLVGGARFIERNDNKATYTIQGLEDIVNSLASNYELFTEYLQAVKLIGANGRPTGDLRR